ncbi:MAG: hypothetical protein ACJ77B_11565 [Chloroflexota bacterium]
MATKTAEKPKSGGRSRSGGGRDGARPEDRKYLERFGDKLSKSTQRAKWTGSPDDSADRPGQTLATRSPDVIRAWAEERDARPVTATRGPDGSPRTLRFDFGERSDRLEELTWEDWLGTFEDRQLVFIYQERKRDGSQSNFFRLDNPNREDG